MKTTDPCINSAFWKEIAQPNDEYCTDQAFCSGFDVYKELIHKATYFEYLFLLFTNKRPTKAFSRALEVLAIAIGNPGPRDPSVHAAMCCGAAASTAGSTLQAAIACGAGSYGGAREVFLAAENWVTYQTNIDNWVAVLKHPKKPTRSEIWPDCEHPPGFSPYDSETNQPTIQTLELLATILPNGQINWLRENRILLESASGHCLSLPGVAACCLTELGLRPQVAEMIYLMLRLPGAAAHSLEQNELGFRQFPFFSLDLTDEPMTNNSSSDHDYCAPI